MLGVVKHELLFEAVVPARVKEKATQVPATVLMRVLSNMI
jgi:hypothetical protein